MMARMNPRDMGTLCICALRYCQGRQSYMPDLVRKIVRAHLQDLEDGDITILLQDCEYQDNMDLYGDVLIDKPGWILWRSELEKEQERRKTAQDDDQEDLSDQEDCQQYLSDQEDCQDDLADDDVITLTEAGWEYLARMGA